MKYRLLHFGNNDIFHVIVNNSVLAQGFPEFNPRTKCGPRPRALLWWPASLDSDCVVPVTKECFWS